MSICRLNQENFNAQQYGPMMAKAFSNEPNFAYVIPDRPRRTSALSWFFGTFVSQLGFQLGEVYGAENAIGQAVWIKPGSQVGFFPAMKAGFSSLPLKFGFGGVQRFMALGKYVEELRTQTAPKNHWYLMALGVNSAKQGQGTGSALIQPVLSQADKEQAPCYLETFAERNLAFYGKHGFEITRRSEVKNGPVFWGMVRFPARSHK